MMQIFRSAFLESAFLPFLGRFYEKINWSQILQESTVINWAAIIESAPEIAALIIVVYFAIESNKNNRAFITDMIEQNHAAVKQLQELHAKGQERIALETRDAIKELTAQIKTLSGMTHNLAERFIAHDERAAQYQAQRREQVLQLGQMMTQLFAETAKKKIEIEEA